MKGYRVMILEIFADDSKFGQKLLEKFGWSEGKGLGAKEDGISNHIKVDYKFGNKGMLVMTTRNLLIWN